MKIELKHLAPYLPYELQLYGASDIWIMHSLGVEEICIANGLHTQTLSFDDCLTDYSPMLRSMTRLTKEIEHGGKKIIPIDHLLPSIDDNYYTAKIRFQDSVWLKENNDGAVFNLSYKKLEKLFEWHFDVFGLIPAGLATELP